MTRIKTERLTLRPFVLADAATVQRLAGNPNVSKTTRNIPYPYEDGMAESWIGAITAAIARGAMLSLAVERNQDGSLLGSVGLISIKDSTAEIGYWIGEPYWGRGYCTEAVKAIIDHAFDELNLITIIAEHLTAKPASGRVMIKAGMTHMKTVFMECRDSVRASVEIYQIERPVP